jgi:uncharacterized surface protein with fasciclin (FAS1) repeats
MKIINKITTLSLALGVMVLSFCACNKLELDAVPNAAPAQGTTPTLANLLDNADSSYTIFKAAVVRAGLAAATGTPTILQQLSNPAQRFTVFAPNNTAFAASGITSAAVVNSLPVGQVFAIVSYHIIPQVIKAASIPTAFPNFQYPSILNPNPAASALLRLTTFPSVRANGAWVNNIPITGVDINAVNGVLHKVAAIVAPPSTDLWNRINTDTELTYLKAAIQRADSGVATGSRLRDALDIASNPSAIASNLTIFAPTDVAMQAFLVGAITQALVGQGIPLATAQFAANALVTNFGSLILSNPAAIPDVPGFPPGIGNQLAGVITPTVAKGIVAYHIISSQSGTYAPPGLRVFSVNLPGTATAAKTLLNSAVATHPGVTVQATFVAPVPGVSVVAAATVKGAANPTASNIIISATPPFTSDLHHVNGVVHKIDQVLRPQ